MRATARLFLADEPAAVGNAVVQGGWVGIFGMATQPCYRRRGLGRSVLRTLLAWGAEHGALSAYLQTEERNYAAQTLYFREGFDRAYRYHYMTKWL